jgi:hypothetical protein
MGIQLGAHSKKVNEWQTTFKIRYSHFEYFAMPFRHTMALPFTLKIILRQKKNYGNSNISPMHLLSFNI